MEQQGALHPFIRETLGPLADAVTFAPPPAEHELAAADWLAAGIERLADDLPSAIDALRLAVAFGSDEAMGWLGAALIDSAMALPYAESIPVVVAGLGWLETATYALPDAEQPSDWLARACQLLPSDILDVWQATPLHAQAGLQ